MVINKLDIAHFGKFEGKAINLRAGMNILNGDNESGKTTIAAFIKSMIFGMESGSDLHRKYSPYEQNGAYGGSMQITEDGEEYEISRSFTEGAETLKIVRLSDQSEVEDPEAFLKKMTSEISAESYDETGFMSQSGFFRDQEKWGHTNEKLVDINKEKQVREQFVNAKEKLQEKRAEIDELKVEDTGAELDKLKNKLIVNTLAQDALKKVHAESVKNLAEMRRNYEKAMAGTEPDSGSAEAADGAEETDETAEKDVPHVRDEQNVRGIFCMTVGILIAIASYFYKCSENITGAEHPHYYWVLILLILAAAIFVVGAVLTAVNGIRCARAEKLLGDGEEMQEDPEMDILEEESEADALKVRESIGSFSLVEEQIRVLAKHVEGLQAEMDEYNAERDRLVEAFDRMKNRIEGQNKAAQEIQALDLIIDSFDKLAEELSVEEDGPLGDVASSYLSIIKSNEKNRIHIKGDVVYLEADGQELRVSDLSTSAMTELLLTLRLALLDQEDPDKKMPLVLDTVFSELDESRTNACLNLLRSQGRQVILLARQRAAR